MDEKSRRVLRRTNDLWWSAGLEVLITRPTSPEDPSLEFLSPWSVLYGDTFTPGYKTVLIGALSTNQGRLRLTFTSRNSPSLCCEPRDELWRVRAIFERGHDSDRVRDVTTTNLLIFSFIFLSTRTKSSVLFFIFYLENLPRDTRACFQTRNLSCRCPVRDASPELWFCGAAIFCCWGWVFGQFFRPNCKTIARCTAGFQVPPPLTLHIDPHPVPTRAMDPLPRIYDPSPSSEFKIPFEHQILNLNQLLIRRSTRF